VTGLPAADFSLLDNGQPAKIVSFHAYSVAFPPHPPVDITLLLDTFQVPRELETIEHEQLEDFLRQNGGQLPQPISLLILNDSGLWQAGPPSLDGNILADAIAHNRVTRWGRGAWVSGTNQSSIAANRGTIDAFSTAQPPPIAALQALGAFAAAERREPGRKLLLWFGPGWAVASGKNPNVTTDSQQQKQTLFDHIAWFSTLLRLARVSLCSVSPVDPRPATSGQVEIPPPDFASLALHPATSPLDATILALNRQVLAIESGGSAPDPAAGDTVRQLNDCVRAPSAFYTLTFNPAPAQHVDEYHDLKVNLRAPGLTARTTTGYYDQPYYTDAPNPAIRPVTVDQLDQLLRNEQSTPDADLAHQLSTVELTERADTAQIASWTAQLRGKKSREALVALADASAFLDPPPADNSPRCPDPIEMPSCR
jgi:VWFA-related protein